jgi:hypothetical protein
MAPLRGCQQVLLKDANNSTNLRLGTLAAAKIRGNQDHDDSQNEGH